MSTTITPLILASVAVILVSGTILAAIEIYDIWCTGRWCKQEAKREHEQRIKILMQPRICRFCKKHEDEVEGDLINWNPHMIGMLQCQECHRKCYCYTVETTISNQPPKVDLTLC